MILGINCDVIFVTAPQKLNTVKNLKRSVELLSFHHLSLHVENTVVFMV